MRKISAVIADDNEPARRTLLDVLQSDGEIGILGQAENGQEAWKLIREKQPDIVLTDLVMPQMDGMELLQKIQKDTVLRKKPAVIVISAVGLDEVISSAFRCGASYYIMKPYEAGMVLKHVHQAAEKSEKASVPGPVFAKPFTMYRVHSLEEEVSGLLQQIGIPVHMKGYLYLRDAVIMSVSQPELLESVTKVLYPAVAQMNKTAPGCVERAIRHAVSVAWNQGSSGHIRSVLDCETVFPKGRPTNSELIALLSDRLRMERRQQDGGQFADGLRGML